MKNTVLALFICSFFLTSFSLLDSPRWSTISYQANSGPISPEYQYNYIVLINEDGLGKLVYTKSSKTNEYDFTISKKQLKQLDKYLRKSQVLTLNSEDLKSEKNLIGGAQKSMTITLWQSPELEARPPTIEVPNSVKAEYQPDISKLFNYIESLVPESLWQKAAN